MRIYMIDRDDPRNAAYLRGEAESFICWIERSSLAWALRTAEAFQEVNFMIVVVK